MASLAFRIEEREAKVSIEFFESIRAFASRVQDPSSSEGARASGPDRPLHRN